MTDSNWQGDMLRRMAEQSPAQQPAHEPAQADQAPAGRPAEAGPAVPPAQPSIQQPSGQRPPVQQPPGQQYQPPPYPQEQYPPQQYPPNQPGPYQQQYPPPPYEQQYPPQQGYPPPPPPGQVAPYQPAPYEQYPPQPPYPQPPPYEQQAYQPPPYPEPQYQEPLPEEYPPAHQQHPGQVSHQEYYEQPHQQWPPGPDDGWGPPPPTLQSDQLGQPIPEEQGDSVLRRFRRIASEAAYLVGASSRMQRDVENIATIRRPIAITRRVGVLSPVTNGGTSTVTALLATTLAAQRSDRVVAVDADPRGAELSRRLELSLGSGPIERASLVRSEGTAEAVRTTLAEAQSQGSRDVGLAVVDCPGSMFDEVSTEMASSGHATVLVLPSVRHVAEYCLAQLDQLSPAGQDVLLTRGVVLITVVENVDPGSVGWLVNAFRQRGLEPVVMPYDAHLATAWPLHTDNLQADTRRAVLDLAARVVEIVTRTTG